MTSVQEMSAVRFYLDADLRGLAQVLVRIRGDITYAGDPGGTVHGRHRPPCPVRSASVPDAEWIAAAAERGWVILTREPNISDRPAAIDAVREHGARMVVFAGRHVGGTFDQLEVFISQWRRILAVSDRMGPSIHTATRRTFHPFPLEQARASRTGG
jgi:hypothetical protein